MRTTSSLTIEPDEPARAIPEGTPVPTDAVAFGKRFAPKKPRARSVRKLFALLQSMSSVDDKWSRLEWLERLAAWIHRGPPAPPVEGTLEHLEQPRSARLRLLVRSVTEIPQWNALFARITGTLLAHAEGARLFSDVGLPTDSAFLGEALDRVAEQFLPAAPEPKRLVDVLFRVFPRPEDAEWLGSAPRDLLMEAVALFHEGTDNDGESLRLIRIAMAEAVAVIAARTCAHGLQQDVRDRLPDTPLRELSFVRLPGAVAALAIDPEGRGCTATEEAIVNARATIIGCRESVNDVLSHLEQFGVSLDLVYRLELITAKLGRLEDLLALLVPNFWPEAPPDLATLLATLIQAQFARRGVGSLVRQSSHRLARKIIERAGQSGEHYITESIGQWFGMLLSAAGGGVLTVGTTALKFLIGALRTPPFFTGLFASLNYAGSFVLMQGLGFTLATKQPSMTAAALASSLGEVGSRGSRTTRALRLDRLVDMIAQITRSQLAAALGNVGIAIPTAIGFDYVWRMRRGVPFLDAHAAGHVVDSLHLYHSATIPYAAFTGVLLWLASVCAGWLENWAVFRRMPEAIEHHRTLTSWFGRRFPAWLSKKFLHGLSGFGGNVALGFFLGMTPVFGAFFGLPLEVRHVTLSTAALTLSGCTLGPEAVMTRDFQFAAAGIGVIGMLNFGVSFCLALGVALRARDVRSSDFWVLVKTVVSRLVRSPLQFVLPPLRSKTSSDTAIVPVRSKR